MLFRVGVDALGPINSFDKTYSHFDYLLMLAIILPSLVLLLLFRSCYQIVLTIRAISINKKNGYLTDFYLMWRACIAFFLLSLRLWQVKHFITVLISSLFFFFSLFGNLVDQRLSTRLHLMNGWLRQEHPHYQQACSSMRSSEGLDIS